MGTRENADCRRDGVDGHAEGGAERQLGALCSTGDVWTPFQWHRGKRGGLGGMKVKSGPAEASRRRSWAKAG